MATDIGFMIIVPIVRVLKVLHDLYYQQYRQKAAQKPTVQAHASKARSLNHELHDWFHKQLP